MVERIRITETLKKARSKRASKNKNIGSGFEREICTKLSLWITNGQRKDCFWRSAMSGGRATVARGNVRQAGDITSVSPEGHVITDSIYVECKHYKNLDLRGFLIGRGTLVAFWLHAVREASRYSRAPALIAKQNNFPTLILTDNRGLFFEAAIRGGLPGVCAIGHGGSWCNMYQLNQLLALPFEVCP